MPYLPLGARESTEQIQLFRSFTRSNPGYKIKHFDIQIQSKPLKLINRYLKGFKFEDKTQYKNSPIILIYFQGNGGNLYHRLDLFKKLLSSQSSINRKIIITAVHYSGYGSSYGKATESNLKRDSVLIYQNIKSKYPNSPILIYGHSLGGAVAAFLVSKLALDEKPLPKGLILENTFTSILGMVYDLYPKWLPYRYVAHYTLWNKWNTDEAITHIPPSLPTTMIASVKDDIVPHHMMLKLHSLLPSSKLFLLPQGLHNNAHLQPNYMNAVLSALQNI
ncbi:alpha/beta-hydrolase, partial [Conidiobolus coronatus NRRL 28638]